MKNSYKVKLFIFFVPILLFNRFASAQCTTTITANGAATTFCTGGTVMLQVVLAPGLGQWYQNYTPTGFQSFLFNASTNGDYYYVSSSASCGTVFSNHIQVNVLGTPTPATITASGVTTFCTGDSVRLNANSGIALTYQWQSNGVNIAGATASTYYAKSSGNYTCFESNGCGNTTSDTIVVIVSQAPSAAILPSGATLFCAGQPVSATLNANAGSGLSYQWKLNGINILGANAQSLSVTSTGNYTCLVSNCFSSTLSNTIPVAIDSTCSNCFYFDGVDDVVTIPNHSIYNLGNGFTIEAWIRDDAPQTVGSVEPIISNWSNGSPYGFRISIVNGLLTWWGGGGLGPDLRDGQCHHIALTHDPYYNGNWYVYVDGVMIYRSPSSANISSSLPLLIGAGINSSGGMDYFKGIIKEIRIWNAYNHFTDINNVLDGSLNPNLVGYWRLNEITGQTVTDYSLTGNNGVLGLLNTAETSDPGRASSCPACALPSASITAGGSTTFCFGGNVLLQASPSGAGYTYQWRVNGAIINGATSSSYTANAPGNYDVLISNFCSSFSNVITVSVAGSLNNLTLQPNGIIGMDAFVSNTSGVDAITNYGNSPILPADAWTQYSGAAQRGFLRFDLGALPSNRIVQRAFLTLYNNPNAVLNGGPVAALPGSHYHGYGISNASWLQRVTAPWNENTITWNNQPPVSIVNQVALPQDTNPHQDYLIDVTPLVQEMVSNPASNYGLRLRLKNESYFTALLFASSDYGDSTKWPKLSVFYYDSIPSVSITALGTTTICAGDTVTLNATQAIGVTYQWKLNGGNITGAVSSKYVANAAGNYTCVISTSCLSATSNTITIITTNIPPIASILAGGSTTLCPWDSVILSANMGAGLSYQWKLSGSAIPGATSSSFVAKVAGNYTCLVTNSCSSTTSNSIPVTVNPVCTRGLLFDGSNDYVIIPHNAVYDIGYGDFTLEAWVRLNFNQSHQVQTILGNRLSTQWFSGFLFFIYGGGLSLEVEGFNYFNSFPSLNDNTCHHVAVTRTGASLISFYLDGQLLSTATTANYNITTSAPLLIGNDLADNLADGLGGMTQEIRMWNVARSQSQIQSTQHSILAGNENGLIGYWRLNDGTGQSVNDFSTTNNDGTLGSTVSPDMNDPSFVTACYFLCTVPVSIISAGGPTTFCSGGSVTLNANTGTGLSYQWKLNGSNISGATASSYNSSSAGNYTCMVTNSCSSIISNSITVTINTPLIATITSGSSTTLCTGGSVILNANTGPGLSYQWKLNGGTVPGATLSSYSASSAGNYMCVVTNACGSTTSNSISVTVNVSPVATISAAGSTSICPNGSVILNASPAGPAYSYQWQLNGVSIECPVGFYPLNNNANDYSGNNYHGTIHSVTPIADRLGNANSAYHFTGSGSYISIPSSNFLLNQFTYSAWCRPTALPGTNSAYCILSVGGSATDQSLLLYNTPGAGLIGFGASTYSSTGPGHSCFKGSMPAINQWYHLVMTRDNSTLNFYINNILVCSTSNGNVNAGYTGGTIAASIGSRETATSQNFLGDIDDVRIYGRVLSPAEIQNVYSSGSSSDSLCATSSSYTINAAGNYTCVVTNACGSSTSNAVTVTVNTAPPAVITASGPVTFCSPGSVTLNANTGTGLSYQWKNNGATIPGATASSYSATASGNYTCVVTNSCGSTTSNQIAVTVNTALTATITGSTTFCAGGSVTLMANTGTGLSYQWKLNGVPVSGAVFSEYNATAAGNYLCVVTNSCGASVSNNLAVTMLSSCNYGLQFDGVNDRGTINDNAAYDLGTGNFTIEAWIKANSSQNVTYPVIVSTRETNGNTGLLLYLATGQVALRMGNTNLPRAGNDLRDNICHHIGITRSGTTVTYYIDGVLVFSQTGSGDNINTAHAIWVGSDDPTANNFNGLIHEFRFWNLARTQAQLLASKDTFLLGTETGLIGYWKMNEPGSQNILDYSALHNNGFLGSISSADINDPVSSSPCFVGCLLPPASITAIGSTTFCAGGSVTFNANTGTGLSYQWKLNGGTISGATSSSYTASAAGNYTCVVTNSCGSTTSNAITVLVNTSPAASITAFGSTAICTGGSVMLNANTGTGLTYQWKKNGANISGATSSSYAANAAGTYTCVITNTCSSATSNSIVVTILSVPATPGGVTVSGGSANTCPGDARTYSIAAVTGATSYTWTPPTGATINSGQGTISIQVTYTAGFTASGTLKVIATNSCGNSGIRSLTVSRNNPATPGSISVNGGSAAVCPGNSRIYTVASVAGVTNNWIVPTGAAITSGQGTNSISVTYNSSFIASGTLSVTATNGCGTSTSRSLTVSRNIPPTPGPISGPSSVCNGSTTTYSISVVTAATSYSWAVPAGATIQSGQNSTSIQVLWGAVGGNITVFASNSCGNSGTRSLAVNITCREGQTIKAVVVFHVDIYPNPSNNYFTGKITSGDNSKCLLLIKDLLGKEIERRENILVDETVDFGFNLTNGIYFAEVIQGDVRKVLKLVKSE